MEGTDPDIIHLNKQNLEDGLDLLQATRFIGGCPSVCTIHITQNAAFLGAKGAWLRDWVARRSLRAYHGVLITVSEARHADLRKFLGRGPAIASIPNGVPIPAPSPQRNERAGVMNWAFLPETWLFWALGA